MDQGKDNIADRLHSVETIALHHPHLEGRLFGDESFTVFDPKAGERVYLKRDELIYYLHKDDKQAVGGLEGLFNRASLPKIIHVRNRLMDLLNEPTLVYSMSPQAPDDDEHDYQNFSAFLTRIRRKGGVTVAIRGWDIAALPADVEGTAAMTLFEADLRAMCEDAVLRPFAPVMSQEEFFAEDSNATEKDYKNYLDGEGQLWHATLAALRKSAPDRAHRLGVQFTGMLDGEGNINPTAKRMSFDAEKAKRLGLVHVLASSEREALGMLLGDELAERIDDTI